MEFKLNVALEQLRCVAPTDPGGEDEPYVWAFFITLDGRTIRQRIDSALRLTANVVVHSGSGRPGNLGVSHMKAGDNIRIPARVGEFETTLRPVELRIATASDTFRFFIPGTILAVVTLIDQDTLPADIAEQVFNTVRDFIQQRTNDFINDLDLTPLFLRVLAAPADRRATAAREALLDTLAEFRTRLSADAKSLANQTGEMLVMEHMIENRLSWITGGIIAIDGGDEPVGDTVFVITEETVTDSNLSQPLDEELRQTPPARAHYDLQGTATATVKFTPADYLIVQAEKPRRHIIRHGIHTVPNEILCIPKGTMVKYELVGFAERHCVSVLYPFLRYRYYLDGKPLRPDDDPERKSGTITLTKTVSYPEFDDNNILATPERLETRPVTITYELRPDPKAPQLLQLFLSNDYRDGNYELDVRIEALLPDGRTIPVASNRSISIGGQYYVLDEAFLKKYGECLGQEASKRKFEETLAIPDRWLIPEVAWQRLNTAVQKLEPLVVRGSMSPPSIEELKLAVERTSRLSLDTLLPRHR